MPGEDKKKTDTAAKVAAIKAMKAKQVESQEEDLNITDLTETNDTLTGNIIGTELIDEEVHEDNPNINNGDLIEDEDENPETPSEANKEAFSDIKSFKAKLKLMAKNYMKLEVNISKFKKTTAVDDICGNLYATQINSQYPENDEDPRNLEITLVDKVKTEFEADISAQLGTSWANFTARFSTKDDPKKDPAKLSRMKKQMKKMDTIKRTNEGLQSLHTNHENDPSIKASNQIFAVVDTTSATQTTTESFLKELNPKLFTQENNKDMIEKLLTQQSSLTSLQKKDAKNNHTQLFKKLFTTYKTQFKNDTDIKINEDLDKDNDNDFQQSAEQDLKKMQALIDTYTARIEPLTKKLTKDKKTAKSAKSDNKSSGNQPEGELTAVRTSNRQVEKTKKALEQVKKDLRELKTAKKEIQDNLNKVKKSTTQLQAKTPINIIDHLLKTHVKAKNNSEEEQEKNKKTKDTIFKNLKSALNIGSFWSKDPSQSKKNRLTALDKAKNKLKSVWEPIQKKTATATRIQAIFRGRKARKQVKQVKAATKIQAIIRGRQARTKVKSLKQEKQVEPLKQEKQVQQLKQDSYMSLVTKPAKKIYTAVMNYCPWTKNKEETQENKEEKKEEQKATNVEAAKKVIEKVVEKESVEEVGKSDKNIQNFKDTSRSGEENGVTNNKSADDKQEEGSKQSFLERVKSSLKKSPEGVLQDPTKVVSELKSQAKGLTPSGSSSVN